MSGRTGTHDINSLLAVRNQSAAQFGLNTIQQVLNADLDAHNTLMRQALGEFVEITTDRQRISGASGTTEMKRMDEYGRAPTQRHAQNAQVGFPLDLFAHALGWTRRWEKKRTPADFAQATINAEIAHRKRVLQEIKRAIFLSANYTHTDDLVDEISFGVKRLTNADGAPIPDGPNGEVFDGATHTHYLAGAALTTALADSLVNTVVEHNHGGRIRIYINKAQEAAWKALTGFQSYLLAQITPATTAAVVTTPRLDASRTDNRAIGMWGAAEVWVKPWIPSNYAFAFDIEFPGKPVAVREDTDGSLNLRVVAEIDAHPLVAQYAEAIFGAGVWTRTNGAVLYTGGGAYVDPAI